MSPGNPLNRLYTSDAIKFAYQIVPAKVITHTGPDKLWSAADTSRIVRSTKKDCHYIRSLFVLKISVFKLVSIKI
jgi:hypothetical protein